MSDVIAEAKADLERLKRYLLKKHNMRGLSGIRIRHSVDCDMDNHRRSPRSFAYTVEGSKVIRCTKEIEWIGPEARLGILLHEILHIWLPAFGRDGEIRVDDFAVSNIPEANYRYRDLVYFSNWSGEIRRYKAKAIEHVSMDFVKKVTQS